MKGFSVCLLFLAAGSHALPYGPGPQEPGRGSNNGGGAGGSQGSGGNNGGLNNLPDGCRIEYQTVHTIVEVEKEEEVCTPYTDNECTTVTRRRCTPYQDKECKLVPQQKCETIFEEVCEKLWRDIDETYTEDVCETNYVRTCQKHWKTYPNGDKKWEDDPEACEELPETKCNPVEKTRKKPEQYTDCKQVPRENCYTEQVEECYPVTKQNCVNVPEQVCKPVTKQNCEIVHTKTPQSQSAQKPIRVCDNDIGGGAHDAGLVEDFGHLQQQQQAVQRKNDQEEPQSEDDGSRIGFVFSS